LVAIGPGRGALTLGLLQRAGALRLHNCKTPLRSIVSVESDTPLRWLSLPAWPGPVQVGGADQGSL
jgi:hypothetical protein